MDPTAGPSGPRLACRDFPAERLFFPEVHLFDPTLGVDMVGDLLVTEGVITAMGPGLERPAGVEILEEAAGCWVFPGLVDPHVHLRTPGFEYKEDLATGSRAAAAGGYVAVVAMANTDPVIDCGPMAAWVLDQAGQDGVVRIGQVGSVSKGLRGEELSEMHDLADAGVVAFADDGRPVADADLLLHALRYARGTGRPVLLHLESRSLSLDGVMHEGRWSARLGLRGIPSACESGPLARDLEIVRYVVAEETRLAATRAAVPGAAGASGMAASMASSAGMGALSGDRGEGVPLVHFQHLSAADSVRLLRRAKEEGLPVTAEVTPLHLLFTDERLAEGTIDCVGSDHAPHALHEKEVPLEDAANGSTGLETTFAALHTGLVLTKRVPLARLVKAMSAAPCRVLGLPAPRLQVGAPADLCVFDREEIWQVAHATLRGKSRNCALLGETLTGRVRMTVVDGARRFARARGEA
jgi:dihydroorotase